MSSSVGPRDDLLTEVFDCSVMAGDDVVGPTKATEHLKEMSEKDQIHQKVR